MARKIDNLPERPASRDIRQLARVLRFLAPYKARMAVAGVALVVAAGCVLVLGQGLKRVIDSGFAGADASSLDTALFVLLAIVAVLAAATYTRFYSVSWIGERVSADIRRAVFGHLLEMPPGFFEATRTGEVISRLTSDTALLELVIGSSASFALRNTLIMLGALAMLVITSPKLTALVVLGVPLVVVPILLYGRRVRRLSRASQDRIADVSAHVDESLHEIRTVQAYGHEDADREQFGARVEAAFSTAVRRIRQRALLIAIVMLLAFCAVAIILWVGGRDVLAGRLTAGDLSAFVFYAVLVAGAFGAVSEVIGDLQRAAGATERLMELLAAESTIRAPAQPRSLPTPSRGEVRFERVSFHYPSRPDSAALSDFSLAVSRGERVALVGPSGAGKSTVLQLLLRYYDPDSGAITLDGVPLADADPRELRRRIALVPQDPVIFAASVAENVRYGRPAASDAEVRAACDAAYASEFVDRLPEGMDTFLGERGVRLSGGQRQRLSIARALLADRAVLLLDEATSSLDAESERWVQMALERLMRGRTTLVVAHRLATVRSAERIVVMDQGRVIASGTHAELVREEGLYARLAALQFLGGAAAEPVRLE
ncbi:MAG TPA: ABC transporter transmembrane domain-containing protein [Burkholderiales bacterium]|nr:ABC transporter transmembrane domain-containing protein [Burkholderiales bacterium]